MIIPGTVILDEQCVIEQKCNIHEKQFSKHLSNPNIVKVLPRFELGLPDSKSGVLTITP